MRRTGAASISDARHFFMKKPFIKPKKTDIDFVMRTFVYALLILAIMHAFRPYMSDSEAYTREQVEDLARQTKGMTADDVGTYLSTSQRPTMLVIYASWCGYCKKIMPGIYSLWSDRKINGDQMLLLSRDTSVLPLSKYLLETGFDKMVGSPIVVKGGSKSSLPAVLQKYGSSFDGGIPYIGFFAPGGTMTHELVGYASSGEIAEAVATGQVQ